MLNENMKKAYFPKDLKFANFTTIHNKETRHGKVNYRPISILPILSKNLNDASTIKFTKKFVAYYQNT